ncbi:MAG: hypothetical protein GY820_02375 [Gammaproteobacteria bacterium]|nr:hypothetical protein [Gammaproteobacteria bacterium]
MEFLIEFADFLEKWEKLGQYGLTKETFLAVRHTCKGLFFVAKYCLERLGFHYVLLGKFQSDPLESRFGWYRQLNGGNYYLSCQQLFENERKIRAISLLKFSKLSLDEMPGE